VRIQTTIVPFIHCYGHWDPENRHPIESVGLKQYYRAIRRFLNNLQSLHVCCFQPLHFVGGAIKDGKTESESTRQYWLNAYGQKGSEISPLVLGGLNHQECAREIIGVLDKYSGTMFSFSPIYFVDAVRADLVREIFDSMFDSSGRYDPHKMVVGIPRHDVSPRSTAGFQAGQLAHFRETGELLP
jgi:hypothetical protein